MIRSRAFTFPAAALLTVSTWVSAQEQIYSVSIPNGVRSPFGSAGDFNSDGIPDFFVSGPSSLLVISGRDASTIREFAGSFGTAEFIGDIDADGVSDLLFGSFAVAGVMSGASGQSICSYFDPFNYLAAAGIGDVNSDAVPDFAIGFPSADGPLGADSGEVRACSGADCSILWTASGDSPGASLGLLLDGIGDDVDGDGIPDLVTNNGSMVRTLSGADGSPIWSFSMTGEGPSRVAGLGDLNNDGIPDVGAVTGAAQAGTGTLSILNGSTGGVIRSALVNDWARLWIDDAGDVNADGVQDVLLGDPLAPDASGAPVGKVSLLSGKNGTAIWTVTGNGLGAVVAGIGDLTRDGVPEILAGTSGTEAMVLSGGLLTRAVSTAIGLGCGRTGRPPVFGTSTPRIGQPFSMFVSGAWTSAPVAVFIGSVAAQPTILGNGCTLFVQPGNIRVFSSGQTSGSGTWTATSRIPYRAPLIGAQFAMQAVVLHPTRRGYQLTNGVNLLLGL